MYPEPSVTSRMPERTIDALKNAWHLRSYLHGAIMYGMKQEKEEADQCWTQGRLNNGPAHLVQWRYWQIAGNRLGRNNATSFQFKDRRSSISTHFLEIAVRQVLPCGTSLLAPNDDMYLYPAFAVTSSWFNSPLAGMFNIRSVSF